MAPLHTHTPPHTPFLLSGGLLSHRPGATFWLRCMASPRLKICMLIPIWLPRLMEVQIGFDCEALHLSSTLTRTDVQWGRVVSCGSRGVWEVLACARGPTCTRVPVMSRYMYIVIYILIFLPFLRIFILNGASIKCIYIYRGQSKAIYCVSKRVSLFFIYILHSQALISSKWTLIFAFGPVKPPDVSCALLFLLQP